MRSGWWRQPDKAMLTQVRGPVDPAPGNRGPESPQSRGFSELGGGAFGLALEGVGGGEIAADRRMFRRMVALDASGSFDNQVMLIGDGSNVTGTGSNGLFSDTNPVLSHALTQMDEWLTNLSDLGTYLPRLKQIQQAKPSDLGDACFTNKGPVKIAQLQVYQGATTCNQLYPPSRVRSWSPRSASGRWMSSAPSRAMHWLIVL